MKKMRRIATTCLAAIALAILAVWLILPGYVETRLLPDLIRKAGLTATTVQIRRIGVSGADLGPLRLEGETGAAVDIQAIQISYTPLSLMRRKISRVDLAGVEADVRIAEDSICIGGLCLSRPRSGAAPERNESVRLENLLPVEIGRLSLRQSMLHLLIQGRRLDIPFNAKIDTDHMRAGRLSAEIIGRPRGQAVTIGLKVDTTGNSATLAIEASEFRIQYFDDWWEQLPAAIAASADITGAAAAQLQPFQITRLDIKAVLAQPMINGQGWAMEAAPLADGRKEAVISLASHDLRQYQIACSSLALVIPAHIQWSDIQAEIRLEPAGWRLSGRSRSVLPAQTLTVIPDLATAHPLTLDWQVDAADSADGLIFSINGSASDASGNARLTYGPSTLEGRRPRINARGNTKNGVAQAKVEISADALKADLPQARLQSTLLTLKAEGRLSEPTVLDSRLELKGFSFDSPPLSARTPRVTVQTRLEHTPDRAWRIASRLRLEQGRVQDQDRAVTVNQVSLDVPMQWPAPAQGVTGRVSAAAIAWQGRAMGALNGTVVQQGPQLIVRAVHDSQLLPGLRLHLMTALSRSGTRVNLDMPAFKPTQAVELGRFHAAAQGFSVTGQFTGKAELTFSGGGLHGQAQVAIDDGQLQQQEKSIDIRGVDGSLTFNNLPWLRSEPGQRLTARQLRIGSLTAEDLQLKLQIEPPGGLFIEQAELKWCQGILNTQSIRVQGGGMPLEATLFGSQLNLAQILTQLGVAQGSGQGSVNGRIPLRWDKGVPAFNRGFLYSTPGETGTIQLRDTESLLQGLPKDTPQYVQLDIATEALKDYTYNWAKVSLDSQGDILKVSLKLDGRPNQSLPFAYNQNLGQFVRIQGQGQADFKGINIDLNFQTPLNQILHYKDLLAPKDKKP